MRDQPLRIRFLGTAAGGGLPQWNCACANCTDSRAGKIPTRTQSSIAISIDGVSWILINASPDLRTQIEAFPALHPGGISPRHSPIRGVLLTNADFDHVLGLFLLRERNTKLPIHCTAQVRDTLSAALQLDTLLGGYCGVEWHELPRRFAPLLIDGKETPLTFRAIPLPGDAPRYDTKKISHGGQSVALEFLDEQRGVRLLVAPDVAEITPELQPALEEADMVIFDGTFWSGDELRRIDPSARLASDMGHLPIHGGSLEALRPLRARHRVYTHINNTNPIFQPGSPERAAVEAAGITVGGDGMEFHL